MIEVSTTAAKTRRLAKAGLLVTLILAGPAEAATSEWLDTPGGAVRLVASQPRPDGSIPAILEVRLAPGWKTYWRDPGASGIPPQVTLDPDAGVKLEAIRFPAPRSFGEGPEGYVGYDAPVTFPLLLKRMNDEADVTIRASVFLGVCEDICIPVQGELELTLKGGEFDNPLDAARIERAIEALPETPSNDFRVSQAEFDAAAGLIRINLQLPVSAAGAEPEVFLAGPRGVFFGKPIVGGASGTTRRVDVPVKRAGKDPQNGAEPIALTVRVGDRSMETTLAFD